MMLYVFIVVVNNHVTVCGGTPPISRKCNLDKKKYPFFVWNFNYMEKNQRQYLLHITLTLVDTAYTGKRKH